MEINIGTVISKVIQLLFILVVGIYARKRNFIDKTFIRTLSKVLSNITNPLLIISSFQILYSAELLKTGLLILSASLAMHIFSAVIAYFCFKPKKGDPKNVVYEFDTIFGNCAFMGFPVLMAIYGDKNGVVYGSFYTAIFNIMFWSYGIYILTRHKREGKSGGVDVKKLIFNPGVIFTIVAFILFVAQIKIPEAILGGMEMVGHSTFPLAMIIIGGLVAELDLKTAFRDIKLYICAFLKLIVIPLVALAGCILAGAPHIVTYVAVILAAMPSATFGAIFAELYDVDSVSSAKVVCITTIMSIITIPLIIYLTGLII